MHTGVRMSHIPAAYFLDGGKWSALQLYNFVPRERL